MNHPSQTQDDLFDSDLFLKFSGEEFHIHPKRVNSHIKILDTSKIKKSKEKIKNSKKVKNPKFENFKKRNRKTEKNFS